MLTGAVLIPAALAVLLCVLAVLSRTRLFGEQASGGAAFGPFGGGLALAGLFALAVTVPLPGLIHQHGFDALLAMIGLAGGLLLLAVVIGPAFARSGAATVPELVGMRFGRFARALTFLIALTVTSGLLLATLHAAVELGASVSNVSIGIAAIAASVSILAMVLPGGLKSALGGSRAIAVLVALLLLGVLAVVCSALFSNPVPQIAYGTALQGIGPAELELIEKGVVDFGIFKPFLRHFLTVDRLNWALLTVSLMCAVAALPPLIQATGCFRPGAARRGLAWSLTLVVFALTAIPALAALARLETYRAVSASSTFADLPAWIRRGSEAGAVRLHGTSLGLVNTVAGDIGAGASSIEAISAAMADRGTRSEKIWQRLDPPVQAAVLELARKFRASPGSFDDRWTAYVDTVVTAAAASAGNVSGKPELASISIDPHQLLLALPHVAALPTFISIAAIAIILAAAVVLAATLVASLSTMLIRDGIGVISDRQVSNKTEIALTRFAAIILTVTASFAAVLLPINPDNILVISLSIAAAGLLPALVLTIWVSRATAFGLAAAAITGIALSAYYLTGTVIYSVPFYETWASLSSSGPAAYAEYEEARELWIAAEGEDRDAAFSDLAARTTGSLWSPGLANWFGIAPAASPVIAIPLALLIGLLVSLVSGAPSRTSMAAFRRIHGRAIEAA
jgi:cation/acetate symporter